MSRVRVLRVFPDSLRVEQALVDATQDRAFVEASGYCTFADLIDWCEPARFLGRSECPPLTARLIISAAVRGGDRGSPFGAYALEPTFARAAHDLFQALALQAAGPDDLLSAAKDSPRAAWLARLFQTYRARMATLGLADRGELLAAATQRLRKEIPPRLKPFTGIEIHHLYDLPPLRLDFIDALAHAFRRDYRSFSLTLPAANNPALDALGDEVLRRFERDWPELGAELSRFVRPAPFSRLVERLYATQETNEKEDATGLELLSAPSPRDEVQSIAGRVRSLIDQGTPPEEIAVVYRDLASEAESLVEALEELEVPSRVRLGVPLHATAVGRLALELPWMVDDGFPAASVTRFLESRYAAAVFDAQLDPVTLLQEAGIRDDVVGAEGGRGAYAVRLETLGNRNPRREQQARRLALRAQRLIDAGRGLEDETEAKAMLDAWWKALEELGLFSALRRHERDDSKEHLGRFVERALARDQAAAQALRFLRDDIAQSLHDSGLEQRKLSRRDFARWLDDAAASVNLLPRGPRAGAVELLEARALAGRHFQHVFIGGLNDGRFPARPQPLALVSEEERKELNRAAGRPLFRIWAGESGAGVPFRQAEDRLLFSLGLNAGDGVTLSAPRYDSQGRELLRSPFLDELERVAANVKVQHIARASVPSVDRLISEADLRARVALEVLSRPATRLSSRSALAPALERRFGHLPWMERARFLAKVEEERDDYFHSEAKEPSRWSGALDVSKLSPDVQAVLSFDAAHPASASSFGRFANCRFQGMAAILLRLEALEGATEEADTRTRGSFWHQVLQQLLPLLRERGWSWRSLKDQDPEALQKVIEQAIELAGNQMGPVGHPALWKLSLDQAAKMIRRLLFSQMAGLPFEGHEPEDAELDFGNPKAPEGWRTVTIAPAFAGELPIHLHGQIDRVDCAGGSVGVVDYKSGSRDKNFAKSFLLTQFQLPFYLAAAHAAFPDAEVDAAVLSLRDREVQKVSKVIGGPAKDLLADDELSRIKAAREGKLNLANAAHQVAVALRKGDFGARPQDCKFCAYRAACRIRQRVLPEEFP
ncbi:MAG: PD-(D/E)XK nuclease family protein [Myxococcaceae bacterium]